MYTYEKDIEIMNYYFIDFENVKTEGIQKLTNLKPDDAVIVFYSDVCKNINLDAINILTSQSIKLCCRKVNTGTKNALDFQLSSDLGYFIGRESELKEHGHNTNSVSWFIVSNDKGYDCLCDHWKKQGVSVQRIQTTETKSDKERLCSNLEALASSFKHSSPKQEHHEAKASCVLDTDKSQKLIPESNKNELVIKKPKKKKKKTSKVSVSDLVSYQEVYKYLTKDEDPNEILAIINRYNTKQEIYAGISKHFKDSKKSGVVYKKLKPLFKEKDKK